MLTVIAKAIFHDIYAIERGTDSSEGQWKAKGIKPIEFSGYDAIYATLSEWARFASRPVEYRRERIRMLLGAADVRQ